MLTRFTIVASGLLALSAVACGGSDSPTPPAGTSTVPGATTPGATTPGATTPGATTPGATTPDGTTTTTPTTPVGNAMGQYLSAGPLKGYCFALQIVGGTKTEGDVTGGTSFAYSLPGTSWDDFAMIGCNLNQADMEPNPPGTWTPTGTGICVSGSGFERIQIQAPGGDKDATKRWCAPVPATGGCAAWADFNTKCWDNSGTAFNMSPLESVAAHQPSKSDGKDVPETPKSGTIVVTSITVQ